jgi:predicted aspartyl protease
MTPEAKLFTRPADPDSDTTLATNPVTLPIEVVYGGLIFVKVQINDRTMSFVFDTGAEATVLNASRLGDLGLTGLGTFATGAGGGDVVVSYVPHVTTKLGDAAVHDQIVAAIDLDDLEKPLRRPLDGIIGYDFISRFVFEIDYQHQVMRIFDRATYAHAGTGKAQPMTLEDSTPYIDALVETPKGDKLPGHFVLDTGCLCDVQLFTPFVDTHGLLMQLPDAKKQGFAAGAGGETQSLTAELPSLTIGDVVVPNPSVDLSRDGHGATADPESAGLIGSVTFGHFVLVLDYRREQFFLDPQP